MGNWNVEKKKKKLTVTSAGKEVGNFNPVHAVAMENGAMSSHQPGSASADEAKR